ncbi:MAG: hypothetical protein GXP17_10715 [Gammaproteobacteria bacterium]|nr:hypothetical protein [Gammaproteobacteria bacterium]
MALYEKKTKNRSGFLLGLFLIWGNTSIALACKGNELVPEKIQAYYQEYQTTKKMSGQAFSRYTRGFCEGFRSALIFTGSHYGVTHYPVDVSFNSGFQLGREQGLSREKSKQFKGITLQNFGFEKVEIEGLVYLGFEQSDFRPLKNEATWWIEPSDVKINTSDVRASLPAKLQHNRFAVYARINAYLSPPSGYAEHGYQGYGHLGGYQRVIIVQDVLELRPSTKEERKKRHE